MNKTSKPNSMREEFTALKRGIFQSKRALLLGLAACVIEVILSIRSIDKAASTMHDWVHVFGLMFCMWIVTSIAFRTKAIKEKFMFAFLSGAFALWTYLAVMLPSHQVVHILRWIILLMWVSATISGTAILFDWKGPK